ncbi:unnamed protein product, partial [Didymodactylos carnosus]
GELPWSDCVYYSMTVVTTIGYGHIIPKTSFAKILTMLVATVGIVLNFVFIAALGECIKRNMDRFSSPFLQKFDEENRKWKFVVKFFTYGLFGTTLILVLAVLVSHVEQWTYLDAFYFVYVTLSTVGDQVYIALLIQTTADYFSEHSMEIMKLAATNIVRFNCGTYIVTQEKDNFYKRFMLSNNYLKTKHQRPSTQSLINKQQLSSPRRSRIRPTLHRKLSDLRESLKLKRVIADNSDRRMSTWSHASTNTGIDFDNRQKIDNHNQIISDLQEIAESKC